MYEYKFRGSSSKMKRIGQPNQREQFRGKRNHRYIKDDPTPPQNTIFIPIFKDYTLTQERRYLFSFKNLNLDFKI